MKKRNIAGPLAALAALYLARLGFKLAGELRRYDHLRSMSNEGPVMEETPDIMQQLMVNERPVLKEWKSFFQAIPKDVARYLKIESM